MLKLYIRVMKALADPSRVKIVKMLEKREMCVCELRAALNLAQPTVSKHLKILEDAGLVSSMKEGMWVNYSLAEETTNPYGQRMLACLAEWGSDDPEIKRIVSLAETADRCEITGRSGKGAC